MNENNDFKVTGKEIFYYNKDDKSLLVNPAMPTGVDISRFTDINNTVVSTIVGNGDNGVPLNNYGQGFFKQNIGTELTHELLINDKKETRTIKNQLVKFNLPKDKIITGKMALLAVRSSIDMSGIYRCVLYHSGFSFTLDNIDSSDIVALEFNLTKHLNDLGYNSLGLTYGYLSVGLVRIVMQFLKKHIYECTLDVPLNTIFDYIKVQDIYAIFWSKK